LVYVDVLFNTPLKDAFTYLLPDTLQCAAGQRVAVSFGRRRMTGYVTAVRDRAPRDDIEYRPVERVIDKEPIFGRQEIELASWMAALYLCSPGEALAGMLPGGRRDSSAALFSSAAEEDFLDRPQQLTAEQEAAIEAICTPDERPAYLFGVTGSGKTEVFLQAAERIISSGRQVIYLVPEITLTHQLSDQVSRRFSNRVAVLHSGLSPSQRLDQWQRIRRGEIDIVIGARSAVFAPCTDLGMIIIDEEHENSYKSGTTPRYHARQVALRRAAAAHAVLVMGSATPSLEAWHLMKIGRFRSLELPRRVSGGKLPSIEVVRMTGEDGPLSQSLQRKMRQVLSRGRQVILFLNRRGFTYFFHCRTCGYEMRCDHCSVSLTYHRDRERMVCHYCGYSRPPVKVCPQCGSLDVGYSGFGTEMVENEVKRLFPDKQTARIDTDTARSGKDAVKSILTAFRDRKIDILLGTQMVAKGLNFPGVDLVGIVLADSALHLPDFRAQERTFSLIMQVSGRAGRYSDHGKVVVQTWDPENSAVRLAAEGDIAAFCEEELEFRRAAGFPPFSRMIRLVFRGRSEKRVIEQAGRAEKLLSRMVQGFGDEDGVEILGPAEAPLSKISGNWRWQIIIRSRTLNRLHKAAVLFSEQFKPASGVYMEIDIDPISLL
jgi:primosomal protein N' (replication factor Y) (superfamily II helicase)